GTAFLLQGIRPSTLKDTKLETVIRLASDIVGVSNDVYSVDKDFEDLMEEIKTDSDKSGVEMPTNDDLLRTVIEKIYNNLVLIRVKLGNPDFSSPRSDKMDNFESSKQPQAAISHAATVHNEKVASYFSSRRLVLIDAHKALETGKQRRLELEAIGSRDKSYPKISAQMHASFRLANEYLQIIECLDAWLTGNPLWSILNRRYNSEDYLESLESIKHRAGEIGVELVIK
ncbi:hypothetical protein EBR96_03120, partial [bacterium]|nr:hypothetical protein [bacterium]